ncbi:hypothetical protein AB1Y20_009079 [Prymnesium parvum]|uniref:DUF4384 domain-containing protein n=1 Tax=Prymnesium parvum TaxID=97485 RepID=A0AB34K3C3_PRYPA
MVRQAGFELRVLVRRTALEEAHLGGRDYIKAEEGSSFEVVVSNSNRSTYMVRLFVDGVEAEPGYVKKLRPDDEVGFAGYLVRRQIHEFTFARAPVDEGASSRAPLPEGLGEVKALVYATRKERVESSSSSEEEGGHRSSRKIGSRALPEEQAVKELGVQARPGASIEHIKTVRGRRRGEYRLCKVVPEVSTLVLHYRGELWWARHRHEINAARGQSTQLGGSSSNLEVKPEVGADHQTIPSQQAAAREVGETGRAPDGKRRKLATAPQGVELIELSD